MMNGKQNSKLDKKLRNVLSLPKKSNWPLLMDPENQSLQDLLIKTLKSAKMETGHINGNTVTFQELRKDLRIGINDVSRGIESKTLACCLVAGDVKPRLLVSHAVTAAGYAQVPLLVLPDLKKICKETLGFASMALGLKKSIIADNKHLFFELCSTIINYSKSLKGETERETNSKMNEEQKIKKTAACPSLQPPVNLEDIYLIRDSSTCRIFHPNDLYEEEENHSETEVNNSGNEFQKIDRYKNWKIKNFQKKARYFEPPVISRIQSNSNKIRKKKNKDKKQFS